MSYDNPLRISYQVSANANAAAAITIPIPKGVERFRVVDVSSGAVGFTTTDSAAHTVNVGNADDADAYGAYALTVATATPGASLPVDLHDQVSHAVDGVAAILVARAANGSVAKVVNTFVTIEWY